MDPLTPEQQEYLDSLPESQKAGFENADTVIRDLIIENQDNPYRADTSQEAELYDAVGEVYGGDYRVKLAMHLINSGDMTMSEAEDMLRWTEATDPPEAIIGIIAGEFNASGREISAALEGTEYAIEQSDIEAATRDFDTYRKQVGGIIHSSMEAFSGYMQWLPRMGGEAIRSGLGLEGGLNQEGGLGFEEGSYFSQESGQRREERGEVADNIRRELDRLLRNGDISKATYDDLKSNHAGKYNYDNYTTLLEALEGVYEEIGADVGDQSTAMYQADILQQLRSEREFADGKPAESIEEGATAPGEDEVQGVPAEGDVAYVDGAEDPYNFQQSMYNDGIYYGNQEIQTLARAKYAARDSLGRIIEADFVVDRSTGQSYSIDEWTLIKTDPRIRAEYEANKKTAPAIEEILNKPFFKDQYIQFQQNEMVGNISGEPGAYGDYWSDISNVREWQRLQDQKTGQQQIHMDPWMPSASPTQPWETDSFDFKRGQASADWMSMTSRERNHRAKVMKDNGLISDKEWANMGGWMYGDTGIAVPMSVNPLDFQLMGIWEDAYAVSSTFQYDPVVALGIMGDAKARQAAPSGGGRSAPKYSVPASLRDVPDYKALATESRNVFRQKVGRDLEDWELALLSDELGDSYKNQNDQLIKLHRAAWDDAVAGGTMEVDYGEVEDPNKSLQFDIEEKYANELDRQERVEDRSLSRNLMMDSITTGRRMIG